MYETLSRARETIVRHNISKIDLNGDWSNQLGVVQFQWCSTGSFGILAQTIGTAGQVLSYSNSGNSWVGSGAGGIPYNSGTGLTIGKLAPTNNSITFSNTKSEPVLIITNDGDVEWHGKPSEAADALVRTFQFKVEDMKGVTKAARRRYYLKACQNILNKAESMEHDEFVAFLQKQVYNKERTVIMDSLKGTE